MIRDDGQADPRSAPHSPTGQSRSLTRSTENWEADFRSTIKSSPSKAVKMQGPPGAMVKCYVKRVKDFFGSFPTFLMFLDNGSSSTFMLAARRRKKTRHSAYVMSIDQDDLKRDTEKCIAKLKANDAGNEYTLYQRQDDWRYDPEVCVSFGSTGSDYAAPRNILVALPSPSALMPGAEKPLEPSSILDMVRSNDLPSNLHRKVTVLCNKMPEFDTSLQMFALDFKGRVKVPSVKNFQMTMWDPSDPDQSQKTKGGEVILQFGKMRDEIYSLDFAWPLTPQTAFAIALSSFDKRVR
jgi:tubby-related protein 1